MSINLTAITETGKQLELLQLNTKDTIYCLGFDGMLGYGDQPLTWRETLDRYIEKIKERPLDSEWLKNHIQKLQSQLFIVFSYI